MKILVIGDCHLEPNQPIDRFRWLGRFIAEEQPEVIVQIGDFVSLDCLSHWDYNHRARMEGRRYKDEITYAQKALHALEQPVRNLNAVNKRNKKKLYTPHKIWHEGNHEDRLNKYVEDRPELIGSLVLARAIGVYNYGWDLIPYKEYSKVGNILFTHIPINGANQPISGKYLCDKAISMHETNIVFGHNHRLELSTESRHGRDTRLFALSVGCFIDGIPAYARGGKTHKSWWRGVVMLYHEEDETDIKTISLKRLRRNFG